MSTFPSFEAYAEAMTPLARNMARRYARPEVCLEPADLLQDALSALWDVWRRLAGDLPADDLCRIGTAAVKCAYNGAWNNARNPRGIRGLICLSLDAPAGESASPLGESLSEPEEGGTEALGHLMAAEIARGLSPPDQRLLDELLEPSTETEALTRRLWDGRTARRNGLSVHLEVLQRRLGCSRAEVLAAWGRIQAAARAWAQASSEESTYQGRALSIMPAHPEEDDMQNDTQADRTTPTPDLPDPDELAADATGSPEKESPVATTKKGKTSKKPAVTKPTAAKPEKKAPKPKAAKKETTPRAKPKAALPIGSKVKYLGGGRCDWLKGGEIGVVTRHYAVVKFEKSGRSTEISSLLLEKAS